MGEEPAPKRGRWDEVGPQAAIQGLPGLNDNLSALNQLPTTSGQAMIPQKFVGWMKGSSGAQIKNLEGKTGTIISIDQSTKDNGYSVANVSGTSEAVIRCIKMIEEEVQKMQAREHTIASSTSRGGGAEVQIPQQYVGWIKGPQGAQIKDIEKRSGAHINIDQSTQASGYSRALIYGQAHEIQVASDLILKELAKVAPAHQQQPTGFDSGVHAAINMSHPVSSHQGPSSGLATARPEEGNMFDSLAIPSAAVGWVKGKQGSMIRDIERRSAAIISIDQTNKDQGHCIVEFKGSPDQKKTAYGLVVGEIAKVADTSRDGISISCGNMGKKALVKIEQKFIGWIKGPSGKVVQEISTSSATRIDIDQSQSSATGFAIVRIYGTEDGIEDAKLLIEAELQKVESSGSFPRDAPVAYPAPVPMTRVQHMPTPFVGHVGGGLHDLVRIPNFCVGWLKGRQGAMIREIESKSGGIVEVDQINKDSGYCNAYMKGTLEQKKLAYGLVVAEIVKAVDSSKDPSQSFEQYGRKEEVRLDSRYVGWVKGPKGKIIGDICASSATRIDVDQSDRGSGFATVRIYGTHKGVADAKQMMASELSKVSPESAQAFVGGAPLTGLTAVRSGAPPLAATRLAVPSLAPSHFSAPPSASPNMSAMPQAGHLGQPGQLVQLSQPSLVQPGQIGHVEQLGHLGQPSCGQEGHMLQLPQQVLLQDPQQAWLDAQQALLHMRSVLASMGHPAPGNL